MPSKDHHRTFRELIEHEDKLIADRNTWFVLSQSFLFISFALTIGPITEKGVSPEALELGLFFQQIIIIIGLALSSITFFPCLRRSLPLVKSPVFGRRQGPNKT